MIRAILQTNYKNIQKKRNILLIIKSLLAVFFRFAILQLVLYIKLVFLLESHFAYLTRSIQDIQLYVVLLRKIPIFFANHKTAAGMRLIVENCTRKHKQTETLHSIYQFRTDFEQSRRRYRIFYKQATMKSVLTGLRGRCNPV